MAVQTPPSESLGVAPRGPLEHATRDQIVAAANDHFSRYGYAKTTVSDLADAIGYSKTYIYRFFDSKQSIGDAVVGQCLGQIADEIAILVEGAKSPSDKMRGIFTILAAQGRQNFFADRKLHDITAVAAAETWPAVIRYVERLADMIRSVILQGRATGEFERKTPLDETTQGILVVLRSFAHPVMLENYFAELDANALVASNLVLRSLAP